MTKRGKVLREPASGPGLLMLEGQQYRFSREDAWKSDIQPKPGLVVDVELDPQGKVQAITPVPDSQLAREQAETDAVLAHHRDLNHLSRLVTTIGLPHIAAVGLLAASWLFLTAISVQVPFPGKLAFTFWQMLEFLNSPGHIPEFLDGRNSPGAGPWGFVAIVTLAGPFLHQFWNDRRAFLGGLLPLAFMIGVAITIRGSLLGAIHNGTDGTNVVASKAVSLGSGVYISIIVVLYFAFTAARSFAVARASKKHQMEPPQRRAA